ncbi:hypothetical protein VTK26DRAFT_8149 [Humicola hyalothermophila]
MHFVFKAVAALLAIAGQALSQTTASPSLQSVSGCAAVVSTTAICSTCMTIACVEPVTVTAGCGTCPETAPTIFRSHGCEEGCNGLGGCQTVYTVVTAGSDDACAATGAPTSTESDGGIITLTGTRTESGEEPTSPPTTVSTAAANRLSPFRMW